MKKRIILFHLVLIGFSFTLKGQISAFFLSQLLTNNLEIVEVNSLAGDDRGGIAVSTNVVIYSGDTNVVKFDENLEGSVLLNTNLFALFSDLKTGQIYSFTSNSIPITGEEGLITGFLRIDNTTGLPVPGTEVTFSQPLSFLNPGLFNGDKGVFSGYGQVLFYNLTNVFRIQLPSGVVTDLGALSEATLDAANSESWAFYGVAERLAGQDFIVYARGNNTIVRTAVNSGQTELVTQFTAISDLASFTVAPWSQRWYFHLEGNSQFSGTNNFNEVVGGLDAKIQTSAKSDLNGDSLFDLILSKGKNSSALLLKGTNGTPEEMTFEIDKKDGKVVASADFNGDGIADLITQKGKTINILPFTTNGVGTAIALEEDNQLGKVVAVGDFNGDGQDDIVLQKRKTVSLLITDGTDVSSNLTLIEKVSGKVVAAGDFNRDGDVDLLVSKGSGVDIYLMQGTTNTTIGAITTSNKTGKIIGAGFFTPDSQTDVILQKKGEVLAWEMDGSFIQNTLTVSDDAKGFKVIGPR